LNLRLLRPEADIDGAGGARFGAADDEFIWLGELEQNLRTKQRKRPSGVSGATDLHGSNVGFWAQAADRPPVLRPNTARCCQETNTKLLKNRARRFYGHEHDVLAEGADDETMMLIEMDGLVIDGVSEYAARTDNVRRSQAAPQGITQ